MTTRLVEARQDAASKFCHFPVSDKQLLLCLRVGLVHHALPPCQSVLRLIQVAGASIGVCVQHGGGDIRFVLHARHDELQPILRHVLDAVEPAVVLDGRAAAARYDRLLPRPVLIEQVVPVPEKSASHRVQIGQHRVVDDGFDGRVEVVHDPPDVDESVVVEGVRVGGHRHTGALWLTRVHGGGDLLLPRAALKHTVLPPHVHHVGGLVRLEQIIRVPKVQPAVQLREIHGIGLVLFGVSRQVNIHRYHSNSSRICPPPALPRR